MLEGIVGTLGTTSLFVATTKNGIISWSVFIRFNTFSPLLFCPMFSDEIFDILQIKNGIIIIN